jgi:hypothetical protein
VVRRKVFFSGRKKGAVIGRWSPGVWLRC